MRPARRVAMLAAAIAIACAAPARADSPPTGTFVQISVGWSDGCAVRTDATVACWNVAGAEPWDTPPAGTFRSVSAGWNYGCGVRTAGTLACWGQELGYGQTKPPAGSFTSVTTGFAQSCAIRADATIVCWGNDVWGLLSPPAGSFTAVSIAGVHACALRTDTTIVCWGADAGDLNHPPAGSFVALSGGYTSPAAPAAVINLYSCGLRTDHTLACWGHNAVGETTPPAGTFSSLNDSGEELGYGCAVRTDATLACWGYQNFGNGRTIPTGAFTSVSGGHDMACALRTDATIACWGNYPTTQATPSPTPTPTQAPAPSTSPPVPTQAPPRATIRGDRAFVLGSANDLYLACTKLDLQLIDVLPAGKRVSITGAADLRLAGQTVDLLLDGRNVGSAKIRPSGRFAAKVPAPPRSRRARARYQARIGPTASQRLRLVRRMVATTLTRSGSALVLKGVVNPPRARRQPAIAIDRFLSCRRRQAINVPPLRPDRHGRFSVRIPVPAGATAVLYRARTAVPVRTGRPATKATFTLPRALDIG
jgi:hypothetical protein